MYILSHIVVLDEYRSGVLFSEFNAKRLRIGIFALRVFSVITGMSIMVYKSEYAYMESS